MVRSPIQHLDASLLFSTFPLDTACYDRDRTLSALVYGATRMKTHPFLQGDAQRVMTEKDEIDVVET